MRGLKRRGFLGGFGGGLAGSLGLSKLFSPGRARAESLTYTGALNDNTPNPNDVKVNLKFVYPSLIHSEAWEGPCRPSAGLSGDDERTAHRADLTSFFDTLKQEISPDANLLKPALVEYVFAHKAFKKNEQEFSKLLADRDEVDVYLLTTGTAAQLLAATIGSRFNKPVVMMSTGLQSIDASAYLRARGFEGYAVLDYGELNKLVRYLKTRKVLRQTNMLIVTNIPMPGNSDISSIWDFDDLNARYGIGATIINYDLLTEEMQRVMTSTDEQKRARQLTDILVNKAQGVYIDKKYIYSCAQFYYTIKNLMARYNCNAFTIECWEFCTSRLPQEWKIVPCLAHSLLKDEGFSSACQGDVSVMLAIRILQTLSNKSTFMGNQFMDMDTGLCKIGHSVPGLKMNGYNQPDLPFTLRNFCESGWGAKVMVNFSETNKEKVVTLLNIDPLARKLMVARADLVKTVGYDDTTDRALIGCSLQAHLRLRDYRDFMYRQQDFGTHVAMAYGDYVEDVKKFGDVMGMEVVDCS